jgi:hypothetical protein
LPEASPAKPVVKYSVPFTGSRSRKDVLPGPALRSATRVVPAAVPSLFQSSTPLAPLLAVKKSVLPTRVYPLPGKPEPSGLGVEPVAPGLMSRSSPGCARTIGPIKENRMENQRRLPGRPFRKKYLICMGKIVNG